MGKTMTHFTTFKQTALVSLLSALLPMNADANVLITEYAEGSGNNKAIEISNLGATTVDLGAEQYKLSLYNNGNLEENYNISLEAVLEPNQSFVIYNSSADAEFVFAEPNGIASIVTFFNGDDALVLSKNGVAVDSIGQVGFDPGSEWTDANDPQFSTKEKTIRRKTNVLVGDATTNDVFPGVTNEWLTFDQNTADGFGCPGETACLSNTPQGILIITEYIEGSSSNKAIELTNLGGAEIDLAGEGYEIALYSNGSDTASATESLTGTLAIGASIVLYNGSAADQFKFDLPLGLSSAVANFNGDDAIVLSKDGAVVDSFGQLGVDPGSAWTDSNNADFSTKDKTLRRKLETAGGDAISDDAFPGDNNQWLALDKDTADGLGCAGVDACPVDDNGTDPGDDGSGNSGGEQPTADSPLLITEYIEGSGNNKAIEISNLGDVNVDLAEDSYRLEAFNNGSTDASNALDLYGILVPNSSIVVYNGGATEDFIKAAPLGIASNVTYFNGDDALVLTKDGAIVDSFGHKGEDPGSNWSDANDPDFNTKDTTLRRLASVTSGDVIVDDAFPGDNNEWLAFATNTADGLGCLGEAACTGDEPKPEADPTKGDDTAEGLCLNCPDITKVADASAFVDSDYYAKPLAATETALRSSINEVISADHKKLSYSEVWSVLTYSDQDPDNADNVIELYTGKSIAKWSNGSGSQSSNQDAWNREHVWSKSHGFPDDNQYGYTDAHHLRPADVSMNSKRSNYDFAVSANAVDEAPENYYDSSLRTWEPRDAVKGDVARMMFYMDVRYAGATADNTPDLVLVDQIGTDNGSAEFGKLCTLYEWHLTDTVDSFEQQRNDAVYEYQGNRNPFIDHPEWVETLFGEACSDDQNEPNTAPVVTVSGLLSLNEGETVTLDATGSTDAENQTLSFVWTQTSGPTVELNNATTAELSFVAPDVLVATTLEFELAVSDGTLVTTEVITVNIIDVAVPSEEEEEQDDSSDGGAFGIWSLLTVALLALRRKRLA